RRAGARRRCRRLRLAPYGGSRERRMPAGLLCRRPLSGAIPAAGASPRRAPCQLRHGLAIRPLVQQAPRQQDPDGARLPSLGTAAPCLVATTAAPPLPLRRDLSVLDDRGLRNAS